MFHQMFNVLFVLLLSGSVLTAAPLIGLKTTLPCAWENMIVRHKWDVIPDNWVTLGHPPDVTTIDFYIALKPNRDHALIDALQEVTSPDTQSTSSSLLLCQKLADLCRFILSDMAPTCQGSRLPTLSHRISTQSSLSVHGLNTRAYLLPPFQLHTAAVG